MRPTLPAILLLATIPLSAQVVDDSDLTGKRPAAAALGLIATEGRVEGKSRVFPLHSPQASQATASPSPGRVSATIELSDRAGRLAPARLGRVKIVGPGPEQPWTALDEQGRVSIALPSSLSGSFRLRLSLDNARWVFRDKEGSSYEWESSAFTLPAPAGIDLAALSPQAGSQNAKLGVLHLTYLRALDFLARLGELGWWNQALTVNWPGSADYFRSLDFSLELTEAEHWDIVLHELGHAVMHKAMKAKAAGGSHKIDECYSPALAWSEGWATFFAAAVALDRADQDAKFEFLVPRRAPIRLENVPEDVCRGQSNEWRVAAGLWDLYDDHVDGSDAAALDFGRLWRPLREQRMDSLLSAWELIAKELNSGERGSGKASLVWNSLLAASASVQAPLPAAPADWSMPPK